MRSSQFRGIICRLDSASVSMVAVTPLNHVGIQVSVRILYSRIFKVVLRETPGFRESISGGSVVTNAAKPGQLLNFILENTMARHRLCSNNCIVTDLVITIFIIKTIRLVFQKNICIGEIFMFGFHAAP